MCFDVGCFTGQTLKLFCSLPCQSHNITGHRGDRNEIADAGRSSQSHPCQKGVVLDQKMLIPSQVTVFLRHVP